MSTKTWFQEKLSGFKDDPEFLKEYIKLLNEEIANLKSILPAMWFAKGQNSVLRKNKSGCSCIINDDDEVVSVCGAHEWWADSLKSPPPTTETPDAP